MQFGKLFQLFVDRALRNVNSEFFRGVMVLKRKSYILVDNLLKIVVHVRIHSPSGFFVVQIDNFLCVLLNFLVGMSKYLS